MRVVGRRDPGLYDLQGLEKRIVAVSGSARIYNGEKACSSDVGSFPRGLFQPEGSFRFSADALLLSAFFPPGSGERLLDMGCGCGVVAFGALLRGVCARAVGLDSSAELVAASERNAAMLGLENTFHSFQYDVCEFISSREARESLSDACLLSDATGLELVENRFDIVLCNPPFYRVGQGRLPASSLRRQALFEAPGTLEAFCRLAAFALSKKGRLGMVFPAEERARLFDALHKAGLAPVRLLPIAPRAGEPASRILVEAQPAVSDSPGPPFQQSPPEPVILHEEPVLLLHGGPGRFTPEALAFCPYLD